MFVSGPVAFEDAFAIPAHGDPLSVGREVSGNRRNRRNRLANLHARHLTIDDVIAGQSPKQKYKAVASRRALADPDSAANIFMPGLTRLGAEAHLLNAMGSLGFTYPNRDIDFHKPFSKQVPYHLSSNREQAHGRLAFTSIGDAKLVSSYQQDLEAGFVESASRLELGSETGLAEQGFVIDTKTKPDDMVRALVSPLSYANIPGRISDSSVYQEYLDKYPAGLIGTKVWGLDLETARQVVKKVLKTLDSPYCKGGKKTLAQILESQHGLSRPIVYYSLLEYELWKKGFLLGPVYTDMTKMPLGENESITALAKDLLDEKRVDNLDEGERFARNGMTKEPIVRNRDRRAQRILPSQSAIDSLASVILACARTAYRDHKIALDTKLKDIGFIRDFDIQALFKTISKFFFNDDVGQTQNLIYKFAILDRRPSNFKELSFQDLYRYLGLARSNCFRGIPAGFDQGKPGRLCDGEDRLSLVDEGPEPAVAKGGTETTIEASTSPTTALI